MPRSNRPNTYERIIDASLKLFNKEGERTISTNHIAAHMGISPGNLYYHFRNKDEIIVQLFKRYSNALLAYLQNTPLPVSIGEARDYLAGVYQILWNYRFLFSDINSLLQRSVVLLGEHNEFTRAKVAPLLVALLAKLDENGVIETDEVAREELALNLWLITKYWFDFDSSLGHTRSESVKYRGIRQSLTLIRPYVRADKRAEFQAMMQELSDAIG